MDVWIGNSHIAIGNQFYCSRHDPEQKDGAEKMAYFNDHWDHPGSGQCIFIGLHILALIWDPGPGAGCRSNRKRKDHTDAEPEPGSGSDSNIPGSDWRTYRAYSEDLHLDDTGALIFCLSPLDNRNGYAVYDSANGARVGTLLWGSEKEADWQAKAQMEDLDHDGIKEIGISMADGEILWYHYREGLEDTWPENKCGCFEKVD